MLPAWVLYSLMANACIQFVEYTNRTGTADTFAGTLWRTWPFILLAQWGLFETWRHAPHFLAAWLVFTLGNSACRLLVSKYVVGETFAWWGLAGVACMMGGAFIVKEALHYGGVK
jgi:drug/metabolite transporter (DMT)-like permease